MWEMKFLNFEWYYILNWLFIYSFLGWVFESTYVSIKVKKPVNRGFVLGPFCTIYGCGAVSVYLLLYPISNHILLLFLGGCFVATLLEYITGFVMESVFHTSWWNYSDQKFNYKGRICLSSSLAWGGLSVLLFKVLHPGVEKLVNLYSVKTGKVIVVVVTILYLSDFMVASISALNLDERLKGMSRLSEEFHGFIKTIKIQELKGEFVDKLELLKKSNFSWPDFSIPDFKLKKIIEVGEKYIKLNDKKNFVHKRFLMAYPNLKSKVQAREKQLTILKEKLLKNTVRKKELNMKLFTFKGGIHPYDGKELSKDKAVVSLHPKGDLVFPLAAHIGAPAAPLVSIGEQVLAGQKIAESPGFVGSAIHTSVSGIVKGIEPRLTGTGTTIESIIIENDGNYQEIEYMPASLPDLSKEEIRNRIKEAGIVGMGGAGFPAHVKLTPKDDSKIDYVIVNCAECEPYLTSDYRRMLEEPEKLIKGLEVILKLFENAKGIMAIEDNKPECVSLLKNLTKDISNIEVISLKTKYPQGAERQLIYAATGRGINSSMLPADAGCVVNNVDTVVAIYKAVIEGKPLMERILTVSGDAVASPGNFSVKIGTSYEELIEAAGGYKKEAKKMISGGPMMGFALYQLDVPVTKTTSALLCLSEDEVAKIQPSACINCGLCVKVCPGRVIPARLADFSLRHDEENFLRYHGMECCDCGCCSYVCPAKRQLSQSIKSMRRMVLSNKKK